MVQSVARLNKESKVMGSIPGPVTYSRFSFRWFKKGSYQLLMKVFALSTAEPHKR